MGKYRIYRLDGAGKIRGAEWLDAIDDRFALEGARAMCGEGGCEVWQGTRLVGAVRAAAQAWRFEARSGKSFDTVNINEHSSAGGRANPHQFGPAPKQL